MADEPTIPESFFEHRIEFPSPWIDKWVVPNPFVSQFYGALRDWDVTLNDISFSSDAKNVGEVYMTVAVRKLNTTIVIGLDTLIFRSTNPDWRMAEKLVSLFDTASTAVQKVVVSLPKKQEAVIAFHVSPGNLDFNVLSSKLVNTSVLGRARFYGVSVEREDSSLNIERSKRYENGIFVRLNRTFDGDTAMTDVALTLYKDEVAALSLLGIEGLV